jgi:hypothetical protein
MSDDGRALHWLAKSSLRMGFSVQISQGGTNYGEYGFGLLRGGGAGCGDHEHHDQDACRGLM